MNIKPDLMKEGSAFWDKMVAEYEFATSEALILEMICTEIDLIAALQRDIDLTALRAVGVMGTEIVDPLVKEVKSHKNLVNSLMRSLHLPVDAKHKSEVATNAAQARWANRGKAA